MRFKSIQLPRDPSSWVLFSQREKSPHLAGGWVGWGRGGWEGLGVVLSLLCPLAIDNTSFTCSFKNVVSCAASIFPPCLIPFYTAVRILFLELSERPLLKVGIHHSWSQGAFFPLLSYLLSCEKGPYTQPSALSHNTLLLWLLWHYFGRSPPSPTVSLWCVVSAPSGSTGHCQHIHQLPSIFLSLCALLSLVSLLHFDI